jgi:hypothetical protein
MEMKSNKVMAVSSIAAVMSTPISSGHLFRLGQGGKHSRGRDRQIDGGEDQAAGQIGSRCALCPSVIDRRSGFGELPGKIRRDDRRFHRSWPRRTLSHQS